MTKKIRTMEETPNEGIVYFVVGPFIEDDKVIKVGKCIFNEEILDYMALDRGVAFEKKKHAQRALNFILNFLRTSEPLPGCITCQPDEGAKVWVMNLLGFFQCAQIVFSHSNKSHQWVYKNHMLFSSAKDARAASKSILAALKAKVLRQNLNCLTKAPADGTIVFALSTFTSGGYIQQPFNCNESRCMRLLESGLLFTSEEDVVRAYKHLIQQINPTKPKAVPEVPAEPDAQPDMPF